MSEGLTVELVESATDITVLQLSGELDTYTAGLELDEVMSQCVERRRSVALDLSCLEFVDSTGLGVLLRFSEALGGVGQGLVLIRPSAAVTGLLEVSGMEGILPAVGSLSEGRAQLPGPSADGGLDVPAPTPRSDRDQ